MKKLVLKVDVNDPKEKQKAMKAVSSLTGIDSLSMDMKEKKLTVIGDVDPVVVVSKLRKIWHTEILTVGPAKEPEKKKEDAKKEDDKKKDEEKKKTDSEKYAELLKYWNSYNPYMTQRHIVYSAEEDPNACVIC